MRNCLTNVRCCAISIAFMFVTSSLLFVHGDLLVTGQLVGSNHEETNVITASTSVLSTEQGAPSVSKALMRTEGRSQQRSMQSISIVPIDDDDDDQGNLFQDPVDDEEPFISDCVDFLLSDPIVDDQSITNIEYTTFLLDYCGERILNVNEEDISSTCGATTKATIQQQGQSLNYLSLNANLRFKFFYTACPFHTPEDSLCLTEFDMTDFGILVDTSTSSAMTIFEERIQSLCSETYTILTEEGLFDDFDNNDNTVGNQELSPYPSQQPSPSPITSPTRSPIPAPTPTVIPPAPAISTTTPPINFVPTTTAVTGTTAPTSVNSNSTDAPTPGIGQGGNAIIKNEDGRFTTPAILGFVSIGWAVAFICAVLCSSGGWKDQVYDSDVYEPSTSEAAGGGGGGLSPIRTSPHRRDAGDENQVEYSKQSPSPDTTAGDENSSSSASPTMGQRHAYDEERGGRGRR